MLQGRTLILLALAAGGLWLWQSGEWRTVAAKVPALAPVAGSHAGPAGVDEPLPSTEAPALPAPLQVRTWTDAQGVVHYEQAGIAPRGARDHALGKPGTLADYEQALQEKEGISIEDIARAKAARERAAQEEEARRQQAQAAAPGGEVDATAQARALMQHYQDSLKKIRQENAR